MHSMILHQWPTLMHNVLRHAATFSLLFVLLNFVSFSWIKPSNCWLPISSINSSIGAEAGGFVYSTRKEFKQQRPRLVEMILFCILKGFFPEFASYSAFRIRFNLISTSKDITWLNKANIQKSNNKINAKPMFWFVKKDININIIN